MWDGGGAIVLGDRNTRMGVGVHTGKVGDISEKPNKEKLHGQGIGAFGFVVCDQLWELTSVLAVRRQLQQV